MDALQSIQGADLEDSQSNVEGAFTEELGAKGLKPPPKTWRRRSFIVKAVPEGDVDPRDEIQTTLVLEDGYRCLSGLGPASFLPSPPAQVGGCDATPTTYHRVVTTPPVGRPIWEYSSDKKLLTGLLYVLESHQGLCRRGWLHGDISANNIFLAIGEEHAKHAPGFMIDFDTDYALLDVTDPITKVTMQELPVRGGPAQGPDPSAPATQIVTGNLAFESNACRRSPSTETLQFMSRRQLVTMSKPDLNTEHTPGDDVESFLVLVYAVVRSLACSDRMSYVKRNADELDLDVIYSKREQLLRFLEEHWRAKTVEDIYRSRMRRNFFRKLLSKHGPEDATLFVGQWLFNGDQILISDALVNAVLVPCVPKFIYACSGMSRRNQQGQTADKRQTATLTESHLVHPR